MIDPKQGPVFHAGRSEQPVASLKTKVANSDVANSNATKGVETIRPVPAFRLVK